MRFYRHEDSDHRLDALVKGTTWLRIDAVMNHQCHSDKVEPTVIVHVTNGGHTIEVTRALIEDLPS